VDADGHLVHVQIGNGAVQGRGADKGVNARATGVLHGLPAAVDVLVVGAGQTADGGGLGAAGNLGHRAEITVAGDGKSGLDHIDAHFIQEACNLDLFGMGHRGARRLFAITQGGVEYQHAGLSGLVSHVRDPWESFWLGFGR
jgi:hypothetical protein